MQDFLSTNIWIHWIHVHDFMLCDVISMSLNSLQWIFWYGSNEWWLFYLMQKQQSAVKWVKTWRVNEFIWICMKLIKQTTKKYDETTPMRVSALFSGCLITSYEKKKKNHKYNYDLAFWKIKRRRMKKWSVLKYHFDGFMRLIKNLWNISKSISMVSEATE